MAKKSGKCKKTIDWLEENYGVEENQVEKQIIKEKLVVEVENIDLTNESSNYKKEIQLDLVKHIAESPLVEVKDEIVKSPIVEIKDEVVESPIVDNTLNNENNLKNKEVILSISKSYSNKYDFIGDESVMGSRFIAFKKESKDNENLITILSISKDSLEENFLNFQNLKDSLSDFIVFPQATKEFDYSDTFKNERLMDRFEKKYEEKKDIDPDKLLESITAANIDSEEIVDCENELSKLNNNKKNKKNKKNKNKKIKK
jgi:hypothetical protein